MPEHKWFDSYEFVPMRGVDVIGYDVYSDKTCICSTSNHSDRLHRIDLFKDDCNIIVWTYLETYTGTDNIPWAFVHEVMQKDEERLAAQQAIDWSKT